jgi:hypothetical protein
VGILTDRNNTIAFCYLHKTNRLMIDVGVVYRNKRKSVRTVNLALKKVWINIQRGYDPINIHVVQNASS